MKFQAVLGAWGLVVACLLPAAHAQGIYTCVDAKGRRITSDRVIPECLDREQKELSPSGTVRRVVGPNLTGAERAQQEERQRRLEEEQARQLEEMRRDRALVARYQNQEAHDAEREQALAQVDEVVRLANQRLASLTQERKAILAEFEFYKKNPNSAPAALKQQLASNTQGMEAQRRFIQAQGEEKKRINDRFDAELLRLRKLWGTP